MHFAREPRENERAALAASRHGCEFPFLFSFALLNLATSPLAQPTSSLVRSCMTGGHECATELALVCVIRFTAQFF